MRNLGDSLHFSDVCDGRRLRGQHFALFSSIACSVCKLEVKHNALDQWSSTFLALGTSFMEDRFFHGPEVGDGFEMIQKHSVYSAVYF